MMPQAPSAITIALSVTFAMRAPTATGSEATTCRNPAARPSVAG